MSDAPQRPSQRPRAKSGRSEEYNRMERLMRGLLKVPKKAIKEAEEREKKAAR